MANELVVDKLILAEQPQSGFSFPGLTRDPVTGLICVGAPALSGLLNQGFVYIGDDSGVATGRPISGDIAIDYLGDSSINNEVIQDVHIANDAAITRSKIGTGSAYRIVVNDADGLLSDAEAITADRLLISDANGIPTHSAYGVSVFDNIVGLTSPAQEQLDVRLQVNISSPAQGDLIEYNGTDWVNVPIGTSGQVWTSNGTNGVWSAPLANGIPTGGTTNQYLRKIDGTPYNTEWHTLVLADLTDVSVNVSEFNLLSGLTVESSVINLLDGATGNIQTQISNRVLNNLTYHNIWVGGVGNTAQQVIPGDENSVLTIIGGHPTWSAPPATGNVTGVGGTSTDNALVRWNLNLGDSIQDSSVILDDSMNMSGLANVTFNNGSALRTGTTAGNTLLIQAYDNDTGPGYITFVTLTAGNTPTMDLSASVTIGTAYIYRVGGTDVGLADGGTGVSLADPGADRLWGWDDTDNSIVWITIGAGLTYDAGTNTLTASGGGGITGPGSSTDNALVRWDGSGGTVIQNSGAILDDSNNLSGIVTISATNITLATTGALRTSTSAGNTLLIQAYDVDGAVYTTFATLTANNTPTFDLSSSVTIGTAYVYRVGGTDVSLADGGTGSSLSDPGADRIMYWNEGGNAVDWLELNSTYFSISSMVMTIVSNSIDNSLIRQSVGLSVIGRSANSTGNVADITGTNGQVLRVSGTTLAFGSIDLSSSATVGSSVLAIANGGSGLSALGTAGQLIKVNAGATALEYFTPTYFINGGNAFGANATLGLTDDYALTIQVGNGSILFNTNATQKARIESDGLTFWRRLTTGTNSAVVVHNVVNQTSNNMSDGFGVYQGYYIRDNAGVDNPVVYIGAERTNSSDTSGIFVVHTANGGTPVEKFRITHTGQFSSSFYNSSTNALQISGATTAITTNNMVDGYGSSISFRIQDNGAGPFHIGQVGAVRAGADNTGALVFVVYTAGVAAEIARITSTGIGINTTTVDAPIHAVQPTLGSAIMKLVTTSTGDDPNVTLYQNRNTTTNSTTTTLHTIATTSDTNITISGIVLARRTGGVAGTAGDVASYKIEAVYKNIGGTLTLVGGGVTVLGESQTDWDCQVNISSSNLLIQVIGATDNNVTWHLSKLEVMSLGS